MEILLVYQDSYQRKQIKQHIVSCYPDGHIMQFSDGEQAISYLESEAGGADYCFLQLHGNRTTILQIVKKLRENNPKSKIIFLAHTDEYALDAWRVGINDYLMEPITLDSIRHTLESCS